MITTLLYAVLIGAGINFICAAILLFRVRGTHLDRLDGARQEKAVIVLPVRGCDPRLEKTVAALLDQDFRDYRLIVVVDNHADPAWEKMQEIKDRLDVKQRMTLVVLERYHTTCSLKCSALIQAVRMCPTDTWAVAFVDADVVVHRGWLADILGPLTDSDVAVVSGSQWFEPPAGAPVGALLRSIWNAGALVPTVLLKHPWAGSMAMRYDDVVAGGLVDDWKYSIVDDGPVAKFANKIGGGVVIHPKLLMVNRESCTLRFAVTWMARMLTWSKIFESTFPVTVAHALLSASLVVGINVAVLWAVVSMEASMIFICVGALLAAVCFSIGGFALARAAVGVGLEKRGDAPLPPITLASIANVAFLIGPVQVCYLWACVKALRTKKVAWRGVEYAVDGKSVELIEYRVWTAGQQSASDSV